MLKQAFVCLGKKWSLKYFWINKNVLYWSNLCLIDQLKAVALYWLIDKYFCIYRQKDFALYWFLVVQRKSSCNFPRETGFILFVLPMPVTAKMSLFRTQSCKGQSQPLSQSFTRLASKAVLQLGAWNGWRHVNSADAPNTTSLKARQSRSSMPRNIHWHDSMRSDDQERKFVSILH